MKEQSAFSKKVIELILKVPKGQVATYGQLAKLAGKPQGSRGVSWILHSSSKAYKLPWQRILNSQGRISFSVGTAEFIKQKRLLVSEGSVFDERNRIDLKKFQWSKKLRTSKVKASMPRLFSE